MKLVGRFVTAAAFNRACHCLYLCLQNTKWAVARNEPLHFLTTASQTDVSIVSSQMVPSTAMLLGAVLHLVQDERGAFTSMESTALVEERVHGSDCTTKTESRLEMAEHQEA